MNGEDKNLNQTTEEEFERLLRQAVIENHRRETEEAQPMEEYVFSERHEKRMAKLFASIGRAPRRERTLKAVRFAVIALCVTATVTFSVLLTNPGVRNAVWSALGLPSETPAETAPPQPTPATSEPTPTPPPETPAPAADAQQTETVRAFLAEWDSAGENEEEEFAARAVALFLEDPRTYIIELSETDISWLFLHTSMFQYLSERNAEEKEAFLAAIQSLRGNYHYYPWNRTAETFYFEMRMFAIPWDTSEPWTEERIRELIRDFETSDGAYSEAIGYWQYNAFQSAPELYLQILETQDKETQEREIFYLTSEMNLYEQSEIDAFRELLWTQEGDIAHRMRVQLRKRLYETEQDSAHKVFEVFLGDLDGDGVKEEGALVSEGEFIYLNVTVGRKEYYEGIEPFEGFLGTDRCLALDLDGDGSDEVAVWQSMGAQHEENFYLTVLKLTGDGFTRLSVPGSGEMYEPEIGGASGLGFEAQGILLEGGQIEVTVTETGFTRRIELTGDALASVQGCYDKDGRVISQPEYVSGHIYAISPGGDGASLQISQLLMVDYGYRWRIGVLVSELRWNGTQYNATHQIVPPYLFQP
ncbi:MAG: hypothetical protein LBR85_04845 [Oscillospiraceae bacterium]|jgi:hypothetical protein|nr:hypothetical protein [Oscillospiraceae bacterium]